MAAAAAWKMYQIARLRLLDGSYDLDSHTFKMALFTSSSDAATLTGGTNDGLADLTNQHSNGNGYTTGGVTLTVSCTRSGDTVTFDFNDAVWTASGGAITARFAVIYDDSHASDGLLCMTTLDSTPADVTATDGNTLTVATPSGGCFTLTGMT